MSEEVPLKRREHVEAIKATAADCEGPYDVVVTCNPSTAKPMTMPVTMLEHCDLGCKGKCNGHENPFAGLFKGIPVRLDPDCPPGMIYFENVHE